MRAVGTEDERLADELSADHELADLHPLDDQGVVALSALEQPSAVELEEEAPAAGAQLDADPRREPPPR